MPSTRPAIGESLAPAPAAARGLDRDDVAGREVARELRADRLAVHEVAPGLAGCSPALTLRRMRTAFADDGEAAVFEHAQLADDAVAAAVPAASARLQA